ncbi:MAG: Lsr2 family protein [Actinomyces sp.]|jgi:hypothetical protein|nr:Lsr2 family protein [Actinomyces sp.]MCI1788952.1 Lsr2 family protein [Actinomyces sp.]MCI1829779.1 Lsr2 family protein [Actinomyces sp.]MCI1866655.1 Lsr2 family protein [Actinomyces sp.]
MKQTKTVLIDDIDGSQADRTISFSFNKTSYEIDLSEAHAKEMLEDLEKWQSHARQVGRSGRAARSPRPAGGARNSESALIRAWAHENGIEVSDRGRIPASVAEQYHEAVK